MLRSFILIFMKCNVNNTYHYLYLHFLKSVVCFLKVQAGKNGLIAMLFPYKIGVFFEY